MNGNFSFQATIKRIKPTVGFINFPDEKQMMMLGQQVKILIGNFSFHARVRKANK
jgi:hypothetical protein